MEVFTCEQGSAEWFEARLGIPTASEFATVMAKGRDGGVSLTRKSYLYKLAGEQITKTPAEGGYSNANMERGQKMEDDARQRYIFKHRADTTPVGFIKNPDLPAGCSPDTLVGADGMLEIKTAFPHILIDKHVAGKVPPEHRAQLQGSLWIAEREWIDLFVYWPGLPPFEIREHRDEAYIANLAIQVQAFNADLQQVVDWIKRLGA